MARKIEVQIVGDADSFHRAIGKATSSTSKFGSVLGGAFSVGAAAAGTALVGLGIAAKIGFDEFDQHQKAMAQTNAVLKSTGGAANVTAGHISNLANHMLNLTGIDDEVIQGGENVLLTFRNIRNEAGKGNDIFDQSTKAITDLSVAMGEDLHSAALQVGKALNDPVKGLTALKRVGVQFTDSQTAMIKKLVDSGHTMEAQKIILGELHKEFGGSAVAAGKTLGGQLDILKEKFKNAAGEVVAGLLPYVLKLANFALPLASKAIQIVADDIEHAIKWVADFASKFHILGGSSESASGRIHNAWKRVTDFFNQHVMPVIHDLQGIFRQAMANIAKVVQNHGDEVKRIFQRVGSAAKAISEIAIPILKVGLTKVLPKIVEAAIVVLDKLTFAFEEIVKAIKWIGQHTGPELKGAQKIFGPFADAIVSELSGAITVLDHLINDMKWIGDHMSIFGNLESAIGSLPGKIGGIIPGVGSVAGASAGGTPTDVTIRRPNPLMVNVFLDGKQIHTSVQNQDRVYRRQNGRSAFA